MCSISVEPMPSMMSMPKCALNRSPSSAGSASPADETTARATSRRDGNFGCASMPANPVGAPKNAVGFTPPTPPVQRLKIASGVGRSAMRSTVAPTLNGKVSALPSP